MSAANLSVVAVTLAGMTMTTILGVLLILVVGAVLGAIVGALWARSRPSADDALVDELQQRLSDQVAVRSGLERLEEQVQSLSHQGTAWQSQFAEQVAGMRTATESLRHETGALSNALRRPSFRGRWGELHLQRAVELAGLTEHCDFTAQHRIEAANGTLVPDLVVHLSGGRNVVVDAKVPLDAYLDAQDAPEEQRAQLLRSHARSLRGHAQTLADKGYWRELAEAPEFVVLYVPSEPILSAALEADPALFEWAAERKVLFATPHSLVALLRTVAMGWSHATLEQRSREILQEARELHARLGTMDAHFDKLGRSLAGSVEAYNKAVGSLESRVLVQARRLADLGVTDETLAAPRLLDTTPRPLTGPDRLDLRRAADEPGAGGSTLAG